MEGLYRRALLEGLDIADFTPGVEPALEGTRVEAHGNQLERRTGARSLVQSGAVQRDQAIAILLAAPIGHLVRAHVDRVGDPEGVAHVARTRADVHD